MEIFQYGQTEIEYLKKKDKKLAEAIPDLFAALVNSIIVSKYR
jgi:DNA-3-methyladenine glycosylase II